jgi:hypothetical protein
MNHIRPTAITHRRRVRKAGVSRPGRRQQGGAQHSGWPTKAIEVIKNDSGPGGTAAARRRRWRHLLRLVAHGAVRIILVSEESR